MGMAKVVLVEIINQKLVLEFCLTIFLYLVYWRITFKLGSLILVVKTPLSRILPAIIGMTLFSVFIQPLIPSPYDIILGPLIGSMVVLCLWFYGGGTWYEAYWTALPIIIYGMIGELVVGTWCYLGGPNTTLFFLTTPRGVIAGVVIKIVFVTAALFIVPRLAPSLIPIQRRKPDKYAFLYLGLAFLGSYNEVMLLKNYLLNYPQMADLGIAWVAMSLPIVGQLWLVENAKKMYEIDQHILGWEIYDIYSKNQELKLEDYLPLLLKAYNIGREEAAAAIQSIMTKPEDEGNNTTRDEEPPGENVKS